LAILLGLIVVSISSTAFIDEFLAYAEVRVEEPFWDASRSYYWIASLYWIVSLTVSRLDGQLTDSCIKTQNTQT
jgi:hypothetical protein